VVAIMDKARRAIETVARYLPPTLLHTPPRHRLVWYGRAQLNSYVRQVFAQARAAYQSL
jgi:hypothetical protein